MLYFNSTIKIAKNFFTSFIYIMKISFNPVSQRINPQFKSSSSSYKMAGGKEMGTFTWFFRKDIDWQRFIQYQTELFKDKDKVNIVQFGASDGTEAYTYLMSLFEYGNNVDKFSPIKAFDIKDSMVRLASGGYINILARDKERMNGLGIGVQKYFNHAKLEPPYYASTSLYSVKPKLKQRVNFAQGDMFELIGKVKDNSNTVLLCRNCLGYFYDQPQKIKQFIQTAAKVLKENSLLVIGLLEEEESYIQALLCKYNFSQVMHNVFRKL